MGVDRRVSGACVSPRGITHRSAVRDPTSCVCAHALNVKCVSGQPGGPPRRVVSGVSTVAGAASPQRARRRRRYHRRRCAPARRDDPFPAAKCCVQQREQDSYRLSYRASRAREECDCAISDLTRAWQFRSPSIKKVERGWDQIPGSGPSQFRSIKREPCQREHGP
jgi:hypothetical protein